MEPVFLILMLQNSPFIHWEMGWQVLKFMIFSEMNMIFRSSLEISVIFWLTFIGDRLQDIERLVGALADIERLYKKDSTGMLSGEYIAPAVVASPQQAFYAEKESLPWNRRQAGSAVNCYVLSSGNPDSCSWRMVTQEIVEYILLCKRQRLFHAGKWRIRR